MDWIAVGLTEDVPPGTAVPRCVNGTDLAIWCSQSGQYRAWGDRCPHRGMRLSHGFVRGERLACIYHGWQYDGEGACAYVPAHPDLSPPKSICAATYDCRAQGGVIWVALTPTNKSLPQMEGRVPVRTLDIARSAEDTALGIDQPRAVVNVIGGAQDLAIAIQPSTASSCLLHALASPEADRKEVSRSLEALRCELEGME